MKNLMIPVLLAFLLISNAAISQTNVNDKKQHLSREEKRALKKQKKLEDIANAIDKDCITVIIDKIRPSFAYNTDKVSYYGYTGHTLKLADNKVSVNFIYIGEAPTAIVGDRNLYIYAKEQDVEPQKTKNSKTGNTHYYFTFVNEFDEINPQTWECFIEIQPNGESHITMQTKRLNPMIYQGYMEIEKNNK